MAHDSKDGAPAGFSFGRTDEAQRRAIVDTEGPMLVVAGPGAGKTSTMVKRIAYLVLERGVAPEHIMVATFSRKAAKELLTRISNEFATASPPVNVDRMRIGTFHSLCQKILSEHAERAGLKNFSVMEDFNQKFMVQEAPEFEAARGAGMFHYPKGNLIPGWHWKYAERLVECANTVAEERVPLPVLRASGAPHARELADFVQAYRDKLEEARLLDYAGIQTRAIELLESCPDVLEELRREVRYIIVDEYQDTNFIQEQLVLLIAGPSRNICVVGDDDQSLYRFRGATVQNILQFEGNFGGACKRVDLVTNYRSQAGIVDFCKKWMSYVPNYEGDTSWRGCRHDKDIRANPAFDPAAANPVSVVRCTAPDEAAWLDRMLSFVRDVQESPDFKDLNQVAFLCGSVKAPKVRALISHFERNGVPVSAPRAKMFFDREEVLAAVGCLVSCFPSCDGVEGYEAFRNAARAACTGNRPLKEWVVGLREEHAPREGLSGDLGHGFSSLAFEMMRFQPFSGWLDRSDAMDLAGASPARNLARLASILAGFEAAEDYPRLTYGSLASMPQRLFAKYLRRVIDEGTPDEYEDEREYAPSGHVSFTTVHQSKGMEFPVVVVCSLQEKPWDAREPLVDAVRSLNSRREELEPADSRGDFDFWRKYYTAFSRAQDLLVLATCGQVESAFGPLSDPSPSFAGPYWDLPEASELDYTRLRLREVKPSSIMRSYAFTSDVAAYQACPRRYKLFREIGFPQSGSQGMFFGTLVHQCVEDIHRMVKRRRDAGEDVGEISFGADEVAALVSANRDAVEQSEGARLKFDEAQAAHQVMKYLEHSQSIWRDVVEPEASVSEVRGGYVLEGVIDLIHGDGEAVEVVDFKTGKVPPEGSRLLGKYRRQMLVYAHLVRAQLGREVSGAKLYFTSDSADRPVVDVPVTDEAVSGILEEFDEAVAGIEAGEFSGLAEDAAECRACPFSGYCGRG